MLGGPAEMIRLTERLATDVWNALMVAAALPLVAWVAIFHFADAVQTVAAFVLRAWHIATAPMVIYALSIWGLGLAGGFPQAPR